MKRFSLALVALALLTVLGTVFYAQSQPQGQAPLPARSRADEMLEIPGPFAAMSAPTHDPPQTVTCSHGDLAGTPVRGSMR